MATHPFQESTDYRATSRIHRLWVDLSIAVNTPAPGESVLLRLSILPWESSDPAVVAAWRELTSPENFDDLHEWGRGDLNPRAREFTDKAIEVCRQRQPTSAEPIVSPEPSPVVSSLGAQVPRTLDSLPAPDSGGGRRVQSLGANMKTVAGATRGWIAYAAMTSLFMACYWAFYFVRYNLEDFASRLAVERAIAVILLLDWIVLVLFSLVGLVRCQRVGVYGSATALLFLLMFLLPAMS